LNKYFIQVTLTLIVFIFGAIIVTPLTGHFFAIILMSTFLSFIVPLLATNITFIISILVKNILILVRLRNNVMESILALGIFVTPLIYFIINSVTIDYKKWFINSSFLRYQINEISSFPFLLNMTLLIVVTFIITFSA